MDNKRKNLIVLFPGAGYTNDKPLLYYAGLKYYTKGYESIKINYGDCLKNDKSFDEKIEITKKFVLEQINGIDFSIYDDILFVSKSLGTVISGWIADTLEIKARHIYLTPIEKTLQFIKSNKNISVIIAGTKDKLMDVDVLKTHCEQEQIKLELIYDTDHSLELLGDTDINIDILKRIVALY